MRRIDGWGSKQSRLVILGEAPGEREENVGQPFVGPSGFRLNEWMARVGLQRTDAYIDNVYQHRPPGNKIGEIDRITLEQWMSYLHERISDLEDPYVIVPTGNYALYALTGKGKVHWHQRDGREPRPGILDWRGSILEYTDLRGRTLKCIPTIHPAATFRQPALERACVVDWERISHELGFRELRRPVRHHHINPSLSQLAALHQSACEPGAILAIDIENPRTSKSEVVYEDDGITPAVYKSGKRKGHKKTKKVPGDPKIVCVGFALSATESITVPTTLSYWHTEERLAEAWSWIRHLCHSPAEKVLHNGCIPGEACVLTRNGWQRLDTFVSGTEAAQWDEDGSIIFASADLIHTKQPQHVLSAVTRDHRCVYTEDHRIPHRIVKRGRWQTANASAVARCARVEIPTSGVAKTAPNDITLADIRLLVAIHADSHLVKTRAAFNLKKPRKIERLFELCRQTNTAIRETKRGGGERAFSLKGPSVLRAWELFGTEKLWRAWLLQMSYETRIAFLDELRYWDATVRGTGFRYFSKHIENLEWVAAVCAITGYSARRTSSTAITVVPRDTTTVQHKHWTRQTSQAPMYCLKTKTGWFVARLNGRTFITGNSYDAFFLADHGIRLSNWKWDTLLLHHALDPSAPHGLADCASFDTREAYWKDQAKDPDTASRYTSNWASFLEYNGKDCCVTRELCDVYVSRLKALPLEHETGLDFYLRHYPTLFTPLLALSRHGIRVDAHKRKYSLLELMAACVDLQDRLTALSGVQLYGTTALSTAKLKAYLYGQLALPKQWKRRKDTGEKTETVDEVAVRRLMERHPACLPLQATGPLILDHKRKQTLLHFYKTERVDDDGRYRSSYSPNTEAGRLSSSKNPRGTGSNAQNVDREARDIFLADAGHVGIEVDASQAEARIDYLLIYMLTQDRAILDKARLRPDEYDQHTENAAAIFNKPSTAISKEERYLGKKAVHAAFRDMQGQKLADELLKEGRIYSADQCDRLIKAFRTRLGVGYIEELFRWVRGRIIKDRYLENSWGRRLWFTYDRLDDEAYRRGYSFDPQSEVADLMNQRGLVPLHSYLQEHGGRINAHVHDSLFFSVPRETAYEATKFLVESLEAPRTYWGVELCMPATVKIGSRWKMEQEWLRLPTREVFEETVAGLTLIP